MKLRNRIGITLGDPKGIGPEVVLKALGSPLLRGRFQPVLFGDPLYFDWKRSQGLTPQQAGLLSASAIQYAVKAILNHEISALVTAPISKDHLRAAGFPYPGHTEFLAALSGVKEVRMMFSSPRLKVVLATIHIPLSQVAHQLSIKGLSTTISLTHQALQKWFRIPKPRIAVAGLNPHAGEAGLFGLEERRIIEPSIRRARKNGIRVEGPFSPDTVFHRAVQGHFDIVVALYHDQGLIPVKLLHFDQAVNITLGLPFVRTSVDHGTAFDIAGKGCADPSSMIAAIQLALSLVQ